jgi:hypothetical protein
MLSAKQNANDSASGPVKATKKNDSQAEVGPANPLWHRLLAGDNTGPVLQRKCESCEEEEQVQTKLTVGPANDYYEQEADAVADKVMRMPMGSGVGNITSIASKQASTKPQQNDSKSKPTSVSDGSHLSHYVSSLDGKGKPLSRAENNFFASRFNRSFDAVRLHTGSEANQAAKGIHAKAFTYGNHVVFNHGAYQENKPKSMHLLAHELTHVVQQDGAQGKVNRKPEDTVSRIQKTEEGELTPEIVGNDPELLLCFILCELGVPPSIWRDVTGFLLQAVWEEYKDRYSQAQANVAFRRFELAFKAYSPIKVLKFILTFIVHGKLGFIPIRCARAIALQGRLEAMLIARGATSAGIVAAEQIARKVLLVIEVAIAAGCAAYCGGLAAGRAMIALIEMTAQGIVAFAEGLETAGEIMGSIVGGIATEIFVRPVFTSLAMADVFNWDLSGMPSGTSTDTAVMGWYFSSQLDGQDMDTLLDQLSKPINRYPQSFQDLVFMTMSSVIQERQDLGEEPLEYSAHQILQQSPVVFIQMLNDNGYLLFNEDPYDVADAMINGGESEVGEDE